MKKLEFLTMLMKSYLIIFIVLSMEFCHAQIGDVIWEENFNDLDNWMKITGNGSWGWGNGELEFYKEENVEIVEVPGDPGNNALHITAKQESGPGIVDQWGNPLNYTSGKVTTKAKVSVQYGVIETRVRVPDLDLGGWPAVWLLGMANYNWPRCGELDMMEMGSRQAFRDLHDEHNGGNGANNSTVNQVVGANAIFYSDDAVTPENPSGAASISWDPDDDYCRPYYNYDIPLNDRFLIYRIYWDDESIRFTVIDDGEEHDLYTDPFPIDSVSVEFQRPFYLIANLAIGGLFTDADYIGGNGAPISMPFPADMYVDYIKVMEWNGQGEVNVGPPYPQTGTFGIYTDTTPTDDALEAGVTSEIYVWEGTLTGGTIEPYEGENGISWATTGLGWFGAGIMSIQPVNLFNFGEGYLKFMINIPANISFKIGIIDAWGNQSYVDFPANQTTYGLVRNGNWGQASIPVADIRGEFIDLRMLNYEFVILEVNGASCEFGLDDIYWDGGGTGSVTVDYNEGWNMVGLPLQVDDAQYQNLFSEAYTDALYSYDGAYNVEEELTIGTGYLLRLANGGSVNFVGSTIDDLTLSFTEGWNLISGISTPVDVNVLYNSGIIAVGGIYGYDGSYINAEMIDPGRGYWVRALDNGEITLSSTALATKTVEQVNHLEGSNTLELSNGTHSSTLYFGKDVAEEHRDSYSLPPTFPQMAFDVRFNGDMKYTMVSGDIEVLNTSNNLTISYDIVLDTGEHMDWVLTSASGEEYLLEGTGSITIPSAEKFVLNREPVIPITFVLHQNFPNPFNPITTLRYDLPSNVLVTLSIYDMLGREVTQLVNTTQEAGYRSVQWDATDSFGKIVSAGFYLYQVRAGEFVQTKKMVLLK